MNLLLGTDESYEEKGKAESPEAKKQLEKEYSEKKGYRKGHHRWHSGKKKPHISLAAVLPVKLQCQGMDCTTGTT